MYVISGILGVIFIFAPRMFGYNDNTVALWTSFTVGILTVMISLVEWIQSDKKQWEYWAVVIIGLATVATPFALGFSDYQKALWPTISFGLITAAVAAPRALTAGKL